MRVIIGLGNPGPRYAGTRHNAGLDFVEQLVSKEFIVHGSYEWRRKKNIFVYETPEILLVKTASIFMNESGRIIYELQTTNYKLNDLYVAHDDLDIWLGEYKIQGGIGPKVHYGVQSIQGTLGTKDFWRIRIGVDNRDSSNRTPGEEYVLQKFTPEEKKVMDKVLEKITHEIYTPNSG